MSEPIPRKDELKDRAADGLPVTTSEVSNLAQAESELTGRGPIKGGVAATAQSVKDRQQNYIETAGDVARKPAEDISKADAAAVQSAETRAMGQAGKDSVAAKLQSAADRNAQQ